MDTGTAFPMLGNQTATDNALPGGSGTESCWKPTVANAGVKNAVIDHSKKIFICRPSTKRRGFSDCVSAAHEQGCGDDAGFPSVRWLAIPPIPKGRFARQPGATANRLRQVDLPARIEREQDSERQ